MAQIALSNVINVSLSSLPQGLTKYKTNNIALFTTDTPNTLDPYIAAVSAADVEAAYGSNSVTAQMARAVFTPAFNLRTGEGTLYVFPYRASSGTQANVKSQEITPTIIDNFKAVNSGKLTLEIDGVTQSVTGLNFTKITNINDIIKVLNTAGFDCDILISENKIQFNSRTIGTGSTMEIKATSSGSGTDLYAADYLGTSISPSAGSNATGTTLADAVAYAEQFAFFGGVLTTQQCENSLVLANSTALQSKDHIYYEVTRSLNNIVTLGSQIKAAGNSKTRLLAYSATTGNSNGYRSSRLAIATYATIASSTNYTGTDTCMTMNLKTLTGVAPDLNLTQTYINQAKTNGVDVYGSLEGLGVVFSNNNNGYTDDITGQLWCKKDLEVTGFNYLRKTNTKIPQTEAGMTGLKNAYETTLIQGVTNGFIGTGVGWGDDVAIPFGNPEDFRRNILEKGYYIYSIPISQQSQADREERKAPLIQIAIKTAGAIHSSNVIVNIAA